jgi:hypothetical protein
MSIRWRWLGYVDRDLPLTREQRLEAQARANILGDRVPGLRNRIILITLALPVGVIGGGPVLAFWLARVIPINGTLAFLGYVAACVIAVWLYMRLVWSWYARPLRQALREMGHDVCTECGYWLRDLPPESTRCPECGAEHDSSG